MGYRAINNMNYMGNRGFFWGSKKEGETVDFKETMLDDNVDVMGDDNLTDSKLQNTDVFQANDEGTIFDSVIDQIQHIEQVNLIEPIVSSNS
jgi:hypothetical protein